MKFAFNFRDGIAPGYVLTQEALDKLIEEQAARPEGLKVPVTMKGHFVGYGEIARDGTLTVTAEATEQGRELSQLLLNGQANCISIGPNPVGPIISEEGN